MAFQILLTVLTELALGDPRSTPHRTVRFVTTAQMMELKKLVDACCRRDRAGIAPPEICDRSSSLHIHIKGSNPLLLESLIGMLFLVPPQHLNRFQDTQRIIFALLLLMGNVVEGQVVAITSWKNVYVHVNSQAAIIMCRRRKG
jgi:hypothetical protein